MNSMFCQSGTGASLGLSGDRITASISGQYPIITVTRGLSVLRVYTHTHADGAVITARKYVDDKIIRDVIKATKLQLNFLEL